MCLKSIGWLQSERTQVSELFDGLDFMVVLRHVIVLPLPFLHRHGLVAWRSGLVQYSTCNVLYRSDTVLSCNVLYLKFF